ncbi:hypothetical protein HPB51_015539 [Rhipicephalus microplus]|uniref:C2H2-type domain-containing protein n=1 Tax=Rhipicephalus microplus TaxID=6941 RepID=A0A9J6EHI7_RHIMP|nr:hypothetical protein HPB51_015539 [Rhipicephalus microplus]
MHEKHLQIRNIVREKQRRNGVVVKDNVNSDKDDDERLMELFKSYLVCASCKDSLEVQLLPSRAAKTKTRGTAPGQGKVHDIKTATPRPEVRVLKGYASPSQRQRPLYERWILVSEDGKIHDASLGRVGSHSAAVCFAVDFWTQVTTLQPAPTDFPCQWEEPRLKKDDFTGDATIFDGRSTDCVLGPTCFFAQNKYIKGKVCNLVFPRDKSLKTYMRSNTGEKPYVCETPSCKQAFAQSRQLMTHQWLHTGENAHLLRVRFLSSRPDLRAELDDVKMPAMLEILEPEERELLEYLAGYIAPSVGKRLLATAPERSPVTYVTRDVMQTRQREHSIVLYERETGRTAADETPKKQVRVPPVASSLTSSPRNFGGKCVCAPVRPPFAIVFRAHCHGSRLAKLTRVPHRYDHNRDGCLAGKLEMSVPCTGLSF